MGWLLAVPLLMAAVLNTSTANTRLKASPVMSALELTEQRQLSTLRTPCCSDLLEAHTPVNSGKCYLTGLTQTKKIGPGLQEAGCDEQNPFHALLIGGNQSQLPSNTENCTGFCSTQRIAKQDWESAFVDLLVPETLLLPQANLSAAHSQQHKVSALYVDIFEGELAVIFAITGSLVILLWRRTWLQRERLQYFEAALEKDGSICLLTDADMTPIWSSDGAERIFSSIHVLAPQKRNLQATLKFLIEGGKCDTSKGYPTALGSVKVLSRKNLGHIVNVTARVAKNGEIFDIKIQKIRGGGYVVSAEPRLPPIDLGRKHKGRSVYADSIEKLKQFSFLAAHDLSAPIKNQIQLLNFIQEDILELGLDLPQEVMENFNRAHEQLNRQSALVSDLLEWAHAENTKQPAPFDAKDSLENAVAIANLPEGFKVVVSNDLPMLIGCPVSFELVLRNLISNAAKHHDRDTGEVRIAVHRRQGEAVFFVSDDGPGIPSDFKKRVFMPFEALALNGQGAGSGLGLCFVRKAVEGWGGSINIVTCKGERGACFRFTIPLYSKQFAEELNLAPLVRGAA